MNIRQNLTVAALLTSFALASNPAKADILGFSVTLPDLGSVTTEVARIVASDVTAYMRNAVHAPRVTRVRQSPSVTVQEMETVMVVATRLPAASEALAQETTRTAQAGTRTRL
jgi:hypothetical protein